MWGGPGTRRKELWRGFPLLTGRGTMAGLFPRLGWCAMPSTVLVPLGSTTYHSGSDTSEFGFEAGQEEESEDESTRLWLGRIGNHPSVRRSAAEHLGKTARPVACPNTRRLGRRQAEPTETQLPYSPISFEGFSPRSLNGMTANCPKRAGCDRVPPRSGFCLMADRYGFVDDACGPPPHG